MSTGFRFEIRFDEDLRGGRNDCIAVTAQSSHSGGSPMSQRLCAGFNWPPLSIPAEQPISSSPHAVNRAGPSIGENAATPRSLFQPFRAASFSAPFSVRALFSPSSALGVGQPAKSTVLRLLSVFPASLFPFRAGVPAPRYKRNSER